MTWCRRARRPRRRAPRSRRARRDAKKDAKPDAKSDDEAWKVGGVTREKASAMCWMKYERGHKDLPLDKRADLVNQCVADAMKANPPSAAAWCAERLPRQPLISPTTKRLGA